MARLEARRGNDPRQVGPFRIVARLGAGGMGMVYLGRATPSGLVAAIKVIRPELGEEPVFRERFLREVAALTRVAAPFTAQVLDAGVEGETPWMATAYVPGPSLQWSVESFGPLPEQSLHALWLGLLRALEHIHGAGLVHRDLKPSNVLLTADGPRVIDFGISEHVEASTRLTATGALIGSPGYMSPEQARGQSLGPASDLFSLGSLMTYAATGRNPFEADSVPATLFRVVGETPDLSGVPEALRAGVTLCLTKDPRDRPSATQLLVQAVHLDSLEAAGLLESGRWLPAPVSLETLRRAQMVLDLDESMRGSQGGRDGPGLETKTEEVPGITMAPGLRSAAVPAPDLDEPDGPDDTDDTGGAQDDTATRPTPTPALSARPAETSRPPSPPAARTRRGAGDDEPLRTGSMPMAPELPPPPRMRRRWRLFRG
ncbi:serine/threonine-protein kinase [Streptomyces sp. 6N223]|uniref:serine/threonine-protein kinase n=1 Tax=Streptomyces sp. 6N223 TaxID=3457412 RepID=UPI003FD62AE4